MPALFPAACLASGTVLTNEAFTGRVSRRNDERGAELPAQATLLPSARSVCRLPTGTGPRTAPCSAVSPSAPGPGPAVGGALSSGRPAARGGGSRDPRAPAAPSRRRAGKEHLPGPAGRGPAAVRAPPPRAPGRACASAARGRRPSPAPGPRAPPRRAEAVPLAAGGGDRPRVPASPLPTPPATAATEAPHAQTSRAPAAPGGFRPRGCIRRRGPAVCFRQELGRPSFFRPQELRRALRKESSLVGCFLLPPGCSCVSLPPEPPAFLPSLRAGSRREGERAGRAPARGGRVPSGSPSVRCRRSVGGKWRLAEGAGSVAAAGEAGKTPRAAQPGPAPEPGDTSLSSQSGNPPRPDAAAAPAAARRLFAAVRPALLPFAPGLASGSGAWGGMPRGRASARRVEPLASALSPGSGAELTSRPLQRSGCGLCCGFWAWVSLCSPPHTHPDLTSLVPRPVVPPGIGLDLPTEPGPV